MTQNATRPVAISSSNGEHTVRRAVSRMMNGVSATNATVDGVAIVEDDEDDMSVGYGGLPNEDGVVQLDSAVMDGPMHKAGAVAAIENIRNPAQVALKVLQRTDHVLIVGEGAKRFALRMGFEEENLLTEKARKAWLRWKANLNRRDDWLDENNQIDTNGNDQRGADAQGEIPYTHGTIHCSAVDANGDMGCCTTTSGLSYKIPGRVGDSPLVGAGLFCDNAVGSAGATGRGEAVIQSCGAFQVVQHMANGDDPTEACMKVLKWIADHTRRHDLLNDKGEPNFQVKFYALRKDGAYGSASMRKGAQFALADPGGARLLECPPLFGK